MRVARGITSVERDQRSVVTVGSFDGVHLGHAAIFKALRNRADASGGRTVVVTFDPHPREIVGQRKTSYLTTIEERLALIEGHEIDLTLVIPFTYEFSRLSPEQFYRDVIDRHVGVSGVVVGQDHMFGRDREAGFQHLMELGLLLGFGAVAVDPVVVNGKTVKSSTIRRSLEEGDVETAAELLGRPYTVGGTVIRGDGRGTTLGFPTANVEPQNGHKLIPANGVYLVRAGLGDREIYGMLNIGVRPTFDLGSTRHIEVHLFDFNASITGSLLELSFVRRLRNEKKFDSPELLVRQLESDREQCLKYVSEMNLS